MTNTTKYFIRSSPLMHKSAPKKRDGLPIGQREGARSAHMLHVYLLAELACDGLPSCNAALKAEELPPQEEVAAPLSRRKVLGR
jgi:hypothetical protein